MFAASKTAAPASAPVYIEDTFAVYLYTGNGSTQTITNGIDLAGKGGMLWTKARANAYWNMVVDTARGMDNAIFTNATDASGNLGTNVISPTSSGFTLANNYNFDNLNANTYTSWTFRKQPKFFDVVTYTGNGTTPRSISHSLGSTPGCIIVKMTGATSGWFVWHRSLPSNNYYLLLQSTVAQQDNGAPFISATSTTFTLEDSYLNTNGTTWVAYLFAHNAGGFGLTGTDNVISCGSFTTNSTGDATVSLGYEPQWITVKRTDAAGNWYTVDSMRGNAALNGTTNTEQLLYPNLSNSEGSSYGVANPTSTGFQAKDWGSVQTFIYIAIRRGPMKTPTSGTSVFSPNAVTGSGYVSTGFPVDKGLTFSRAGGNNWYLFDRLRGSGDYGSYVSKYLYTNNTGPESSQTGYGLGFDDNVGYSQNWWTSENAIYYNFRRAPGFFDEVCYTGNGTSGATQTHNLGVVPELMIVKKRSGAAGWNVYSAATGNTKVIYLDGTGAAFTFSGSWNNTTPTSTVFTLGNDAEVNGSGSTYVAYLFATLAGVSKVGSYTGTGTTKQIDCGFTGGARFVLIRRTDSTGDWYVWDSARGIVAGNDPYLLLNSTAAEVTSTDYVDTYSAGFEISSTAPAAINANGGTFIFLAIA